MNNKTLLYNKENGIGIVTFNRPDALNAMNSLLIEELAFVMDEAEKDPAVRVLIFSGGEDVFCSGADLKDNWTTENSRRLSRVFLDIEASAKPTIAVVNGYAMGAGCELMLCCDLRVVSLTAKIALPEIKVGIMPTAGGTFRLPQLVGLPKAKEMLFMGDTISGSDAFSIGLANRVTSPELTMDEARNIATKLIEQPPLSLKAIKACVRNSLLLDAERAMDFVLATSEALRGTEDYQEGRRAFREKRKPLWTGR